MLQPSVLNPSTPCSLTNGQHPTTGCPGTTCAQYPSTTYCDGQDPIAGGCSGDAYTVTSASITGLLNQNGTLKIVTVGEVDLRYSPTCASNWARAVLYTSDSQVQQEIGGFADFNATIKRCTDGKTFTATTSTDAYPLNTNIYGDMVYAPTAPADASATTDFPSSDGDTGCH